MSKETNKTKSIVNDLNTTWVFTLALQQGIFIVSIQRA